jgi:hypothetical protein
MFLIEIFSHSNRIHYRTSFNTLATCFLVICTTLTFLSPFLWTYFAGGFWIKEDLFVEQARVGTFVQHLLIVNGDPISNQYFTSSYSSLNAALRTIYTPGVSTVTAIDDNQDGITDQLQTTVEIILPTSNFVAENIQLWLILQYELQARQHIIMETAAFVQLTLPNGNSNVNDIWSVTVVGDLVFQQKQPLRSSGNDTTYNGSLLSLSKFVGTSSLNLDTIAEEYLRRKYNTFYRVDNINWNYGLNNDRNKITVNVKMNIKSQSIRFIPGFWQEFKWGWIQYVSVLVPFIVVSNRIKEFVFRSQLVRTKVRKPYRQT